MCATLSAWSFAPLAQASATDPLIEGAKQCTKLLPQYEKQYGIPAHLLSAIAATESGRYHEHLKIRIPWPWTINAEGRGYYFNSKSEAIAAARKLMARGVQSIDVGCMQVNLVHHADAFSSLEQAFEPRHNIGYAASFLSTLYQDVRSWKQAAAAYHSKTPAKGSRYVGRVYDSWQRLVDKLRLAQLKVPANSLAEMSNMKFAAAKPQAPKPKSSTDLIYAANMPKAVASKIAPPVVTKVAAAKRPDPVIAKPVYAPPRMNSVELSKKKIYRENGVIVVKPDIQAKQDTPVVAAPVLAADTGIFRVNSPVPVSSRKTGPNFIFSN